MTDVQACVTGACLREAAAYVRVSSERQDRSIATQLDFTELYAARAGCRIVRVYCDEAKSGVTLRGRWELRHLLQDVGAAHPGYSMILVYGVSR